MKKSELLARIIALETSNAALMREVLELRNLVRLSGQPPLPSPPRIGTPQRDYWPNYPKDFVVTCSTQVEQ